MNNVDMFVINVKSDDQIEVLDLWSTGESLPPPDTDTTKGYTYTAATATATGYTQEFTRNLDTGDAAKDTKLVVGSDYTWGWACKVNEKVMTTQHDKVGPVTTTFGKDGVAAASSNPDDDDEKKSG
jgi:hypothetical protein